MRCTRNYKESRSPCPLVNGVRTHVPFNHHYDRDPGLGRVDSGGAPFDHCLSLFPLSPPDDMPPTRTQQSSSSRSSTLSVQSRTTRSSTRKASIGKFSRSTSPLTEYEYEDADGDPDSDVDAEADVDPDYQHEATEPATTPGAQGSIPLEKATKAPRRDPIVIKGQTLEPTIGFNVFWWLCAERQGIELRRRSGLPSPWTTNKILMIKFVCNTFRVCDKTCQYFIKNIVEKGPSSPRELLFRVLLFHSFTKVETWESLDEQLGPLTWANFDRKRYNRVLSKMRGDGVVLFSPAFQKQPGREKAAWTFQLDVLEKMMAADNLLRRLRPPKSMTVYMEDIYEYLLDFVGIGPFNAYQLCINLSYTPLLPCSGWDFVAPGPGAHSGLTKLFGESLNIGRKALGLTTTDITFEGEIIRWMAKNQREEFARLDLPFVGMDKDHPDMELADIEHAICETDKILRSTHPNLQGAGKVGDKKRKFTHAPITQPIVLPKVWKTKKRKTVMVRPEREAEQMWKIEDILDHVIGPDGKVLFHVSWVGYPPEGNTWEPEDKLVQDIPGMVKNYVVNNNVTLPIREH